MMAVRTILAAVVILLCTVPAESLGQTVVHVSYTDEWFQPNGAIGQSTIGDIYIAGDGRQRHDWTLTGVPRKSSWICVTHCCITRYTDFEQSST